jgi:hypothetical protein
MNIFSKYFSLIRLRVIVAVWVFGISVNTVNAQFAPPVGQNGTTAIKKDSSIFVAWANFCESQRGYVDISKPDLGLTTYGIDSVAIGIANNSVLSLGDAGSALLKFELAIVDGPGYDFAIFENSFDNEFLELAFVEVSSDGENFFRFENTSNTQTEIQVATFGTIDATKINNLAGKYRGGYGVPFDLNELKDISGLDIHNIVAIKLIDVVGSIDEEFASFDSNGNIINDPWPTPFESSGFDLDAIGVIHDVEHTAINEFGEITDYTVGPNPFTESIKINGLLNVEEISIFTINSEMVFSLKTKNQNFIEINANSLPKGLLFVQIKSKNNTVTKKILHL